MPAVASPAVSLAGFQLARHLLIFCCHGGTPFVDLHMWPPNENKFHFLDPTDWIATDTRGSLLNASVHPEILKNNPEVISLIPLGVSLDRCDLYNLTFSSAYYQTLFDDANGSLSCKCPVGFWGAACELAAAQAVRAGVTAFNPMLLVVLIPASLLALVAVGVLIIRVGWCDCFGPCKFPWRSDEEDDLDGPLDQNTINRCLEAVRKHEATNNARFGEGRASGSQAVFERETLIPTVSEGCAPVDYPSAPPPCSYSHGRCSPPPSYKSSPSESEEHLPRFMPSATTEL